jgi:nitrate/TMAO reductase-like tetraheme cytochrome c subunit
MKKIRERLTKFFFPSPDSPRWILILPYLTLGLLALMLIGGSMYGWEYTNTSHFCGTTCHTMPPQYAAYLQSPHANVTCEECHIGRAAFFNQLTRKSQALHEIYYMTFKLYEYPIRAKALRPARDTCEKCHQPETFSDDSLRVLTRYASDLTNTQSSIYLIMKTGGGAKREGLGRGIHWHIVNKVEYYATDTLSRDIPYIRVYNDDGTTTEYTDVESGFDKSKLNESQLKTMDCVTCHNRVTHSFKTPSNAVDEAMTQGAISSDIPFVHQKAVEVLSASYKSRDEAFTAFDKFGDYYKNTDYYLGHGEQIKSAVQALKDIYDRNVFQEQKVDWITYPNNLGHINSPGCFRCHDGKHMDANNQAIRLECNLCHSAPVVAGQNDFLTKIEINRGPEPDTHLNPNWISLHNQAFGASCSTCHSTKDPGGTSNTSFCSNSVCHGNVYTYAGFDAPKLREILQSQLPPPEPALPTLTDAPTFDNYVGALFTLRCSACHGDQATAGLNLLTYETTMKGGKDGAVILPGDSANSLLFKIQSTGTHHANLSADELAIVQQWIDAGAPQK